MYVQIPVATVDIYQTMTSSLQALPLHRSPDLKEYPLDLNDLLCTSMSLSAMSASSYNPLKQDTQQ